MYLQLVRCQEHDWEGPLFRVLAAFLEIIANGAVRSRGAHGTRRKQRLRQHLLVTDDGWPWRVALQPGPVEITRPTLEM